MTSNIIRSHWFTYKGHEADSIRFQPRVISAYDEIPTGFLAEFPGGDEGFPYTVLIPAGEASLFQEKINPQMLCLYQDRLVNLEAVQGEIETHEYALKSITSVEHGRVLLNSWLTIHSASRNKTFNFTSTVEQVFSPIIEAIRGTADVRDVQDSATKTREEIAKLSYLWKLNIKYFNYAKQSLAPGATIQASVYQGDIPLSKLNVFKKPVFSSHLSGHMAMLTDRELVFIKESEEIREIHDTSYGGVFNYIPLEKIRSLRFESNDDKKVDCLMNIQLVDGKYYQFQFSTSTAVQLEEFKHACAQVFASA